MCVCVCLCVCVQTGPKGVLTDYYRKMEEDKRMEILAEEKRREMIIQHSATVQSHVSCG